MMLSLTATHSNWNCFDAQKIAIIWYEKSKKEEGEKRSKIAKEDGKSEEEIYWLKSRRKYGANFLLALLKCLVFFNKEIWEWALMAWKKLDLIKIEREWFLRFITVFLNLNN